MKTIEAVIENSKFDKFLPWAASTIETNYIRLYSGTNDEEIGSIMLSACSLSNGELIKETGLERLKEFISNEGFVLAGGLVFKENEEIKVIPNCCCGLEDWNEWLNVPSGKCQIWTGHDPESLIEINDGKIKIWQDRKSKSEDQSIEFTIDEMFEKLQYVEKDLKNFLFRLGQWTRFIAPELEKQVVEHFAKNMNIR
ncbi:MAG TPA: hypothetical protein PKY82_12815 [Pyrinomonadaceae bacterium]|nr:hypothetical protein [Pyrinomonadaceae bacterium]